jgi:hypothetical protein
MPALTTSPVSLGGNLRRSSVTIEHRLGYVVNYIAISTMYVARPHSPIHLGMTPAFTLYIFGP